MRCARRPSGFSKFFCVMRRERREENGPCRTDREIKSGAQNSKHIQSIFPATGNSETIGGKQRLKLLFIVVGFGGKVAERDDSIGLELFECQPGSFPKFNKVSLWCVIFHPFR